MRRLGWLVPVALLAACSGESFHGDSGSQIDTGTAGVDDPGMGGESSAVGGSVGAAGDLTAGAPGSGGREASGGTESSGGRTSGGGSPSTGGVLVSGGSGGSGDAPSWGGGTGGAGGSVGVGGRGTGGTPTGSGGEPASGGAEASGGEPGSGGAEGSGGEPGSGGEGSGGEGSGGEGSGGEPGSGGSHPGGSAGAETGGAAGDAGAGGVPGTGGLIGVGGIVAFGGTGGIVQGPGPECVEASECGVLDDCCSCTAVPIEQAGEQCDTTCPQTVCDAENIPSDATQCVAGHCNLGLDCDPSNVVCLQPQPDCGEGRVPMVVGNCWGACVDASDCASVPSCDDCDKDRHVCVVLEAHTRTHHCAEVPTECLDDRSCDCLQLNVCVGVYGYCSDGTDGEIHCSCPDC